jgi:hypothetical protein
MRLMLIQLRATFYRTDGSLRARSFIHRLSVAPSIGCLRPTDYHRRGRQLGCQDRQSGA